MLSLDRLLEIARDGTEAELGVEERTEFDRFIRRARIARPNATAVARPSMSIVGSVKTDQMESRRRQRGPISQERVWMWAAIISGVAASVAIASSVSSFTRARRLELVAHRSSMERDAAVARLARLESDIESQRVERTPASAGATNHLRLTAGHESTPVDWERTLEHHYDGSLRTPEQNLARLESVSGAVRAEASRLRRENPTVTAKEILDSLFQAWGKPFH